MRKQTLIPCLTIIVCLALLVGIGATPRYLEELAIGGGYGDASDGGAWFEKDGDILTDGDLTVDGAISGGSLTVTTPIDISDDTNLTATSPVALTGDDLGIVANSIGTAHIGTDGVDTDEIASSAVDNDEIATDAVRAAEIQADAVGTSEIATNGVDTDEIAADAVGASELDEAAAVTFASVTSNGDVNVVGNIDSQGSGLFMEMGGTGTTDRFSVGDADAGYTDFISAGSVNSIQSFSGDRASSQNMSVAGRFGANMALLSIEADIAYVDGSVGIGTASPARMLEVFTSDAQVARFTRDLATDNYLELVMSGAAPEYTRFDVSGASGTQTDVMRINNDNTVLIPGLLKLGSDPVTINAANGSILMAALEENIEPAYSGLWLHAGDVDNAYQLAVAEGVLTKMTGFNSTFGNVGLEDADTNAVGSTANSEITIGAGGGGVYVAEASASFSTDTNTQEIWIGIAREFATPISITSSTGDTPIVVTAPSHGLDSGDAVFNSGHVTQTEVNGSWMVEVVDSSSFKLLDWDGTDSVGTGAGTGGTIDLEVHGSLITHRKTGTLNDVGSASITGKIEVVASDVVYGIMMDITTTDGVNVEAFAISINRVHGI